MKIAAIIVTCNRKEQVLQLLEDFKRQTRRPEGIIVIDNGSEDGTEEHILRLNFPYVELIRLKENDGLWKAVDIGIKKAMDEGYDAVWLIDDDARMDDKALENLMEAIKIHENLRNSVVWSTNLSHDGRFFTEPVGIKVDGEWKIYHEFEDELENGVYETTGGPNIGIYIPRSVIESVGPPRADMVMSGEIEFISRLKIRGIKMYRCFSSILYHKRHDFYRVRLFGKTRYMSRASTWRTYYEIRNMVYTDRLYKRRTLLKSLLITSLDSIIKIYICDKKLSTAYYIMKGIYDGLRGNMGMRVKIPR